MGNETVVTVVGNLVQDPELRFTPSGAAVASFTIASTPSRFDKDSGTWKDGDTLFLRCSIWRAAAENAVESLTKGVRVIAQGRLVQRSYETKEGEKRTVVEMQVDELGPSLRSATVKVNKVVREKTVQRRPDGGSWPQDDPWGSPPASASAPADDDQPPF